VLIVIRCLLIYPNADSALNEEAGRLIHGSYDEFFQRAQLYTKIHAMRSEKNTQENSDAVGNCSINSKGKNNVSNKSSKNPLKAQKKSGRRGKRKPKKKSTLKRYD